MAAEFCTVTPNICVPSGRNLLPVAFLARKNKAVPEELGKMGYIQP